MAARAHFVQDYPLATPHARTRRQVWYRHDPVVVPRSSWWRAGGGLIATALAMGAIVVATAYGAYHSEPPVLLTTPAAPLVDTWQLDPLVQEANVTNLLAGPAHAVPSLAGSNNSARLDEEPIFSAPELTARGVPQSSTTQLSPETSTEQPLPGTRTLPYAGPTSTPALPYPNPTTTPPEAVAPPDATPQTPTPVLDPENPYRD